MALAVDVTLCVAMKGFREVGGHEDVIGVESLSKALLKSTIDRCTSREVSRSKP